MTPPSAPPPSSPPAAPPRSAFRLVAMLQRPGLRRFGRVTAQGVFWSWNVVFLCVFYLGLLPVVLWDLLRQTVMGLVPWDFLGFSAVLLLIPLLCTVLGALRLRAAPGKLLALLLGIEGPLIMLCLFRLFLVRELQPAAAQLLLSFCIGVYFYAYELFSGVSARKRTLDVQLLGHALHLGAGLYLGAWIGLYSPPIIYAVLDVILSFTWVHGLFEALRSMRLWELVFVPLSGLLFLYTALLLAGSPLCAIVLSVRCYRRVARAHAAVHGRARTALLTALVLGSSAALLVVLNRQPQGRAFALLSQPPRDAAAEQALLRQSGVIRAGLLNAYLGQYRYLGATGDDRLLTEIYRDVFRTSRETWAPLQALHRALAAPFLYQGESTAHDEGRAEELYEQFFDAPLQKTERAEVLRALEATYSPEEREAGLLNIGQRKVRLVRQEVQVAPKGDVAEVELYEVYENQTYQPQEIFYYFTLPESAAVTGLWLGNSADRAQRFQPVVAPRGAAQRVYKAEVARRFDPALLEEIGPRQYRLRAFPVPERPALPQSQWAWLKRQVLDPAQTAKLHLWLTYVAFADERGVPLPEITERRNIYRDGSTERLLAGQRVPSGVDWLPDHAPVARSQAATAYDIDLKEGYRVHVQPGLSSPALPREQALAVVVDRSRSMARVEPQLGDALRWLRDGQGQGDALGAHNRLDLYLTAAASRPSGPRRIDRYTDADLAEAVRPYGGMRLRAALQQFGALRGNTAYGAVFLLTDDGSLDLAQDEAPPPDLGAPLFIVHLGGRLAPGYDDGTLHAVQQRGGGVETSIQAALRRYAEGTAGASMDGRYFTVQQAPGPAAGPAGPLQALAARQVILHKLRDVRPDEPATLDPLHGLAQAYSVVTPLSSLLVLVEDRQRERLSQEEHKPDRFDRQVESGQEALPHVSGTFGLTAAPEPAEWLLCGLAAVVLGWSARRRAAARRGLAG